MMNATEILDYALAFLDRWISFVVSEVHLALSDFGLVASSDVQTTRYALGAVCLALALGVLFLLFKKRRTSSLRMTSLAALTRGPRMAGGFAMAIFLGVLFGWSFLAPLASATVASGIVNPGEGRVEINHLEGGILQTIHVTEGQRVEIGDPLVTLDDTTARAGQEELYTRYHYLLSTKARLIAEVAEDKKIMVPKEIAEVASPDVSRHIDGQQKLLESRLATFSLREDILDTRLRQLNEQIAGFEGVIAALERQRELIEQEITGVRDLYERGLQRLPRLLELERGLASIDADIAANRGRILETRQMKSEAEVQRLALLEQFYERANNELVEAERQIAEVRSQLPTRDDRLARTTITSPVSGAVINIANLNEARVVRPGELLMEVVPKDVELTIDARVATTDIDRVFSGMSARVVLTAYKQRNLPQIHGSLVTVSPDALTDEKDGLPYYLAKIRLDDEALAAVPEVTLMPGMPAEVLLLDEERTLVSYLFDPVMSSIERSFLED